jgi:LL-diaminopimelate aminotransferase
LKEFRETVALWYDNRFGVKLKYESEVHALIGSKEGIGHLPLAFVNPGDVVLVPDPGYPVYRASTIFAGGVVYPLPLLEENNFLPDLTSVPEDILKKAKLMFLNYPNNPTAAVATGEFFEKVVKFAKKHNIIVAHDAAYTELYFTSAPTSFLSASGAGDVGIEFHSLSKTYNMTGWRISWICGNSHIISGLSKVKDNYDSGVFSAIQKTGIAALTGSQECVESMRKIYKARRDILVKGLSDMGWKFRIPEATFYLWARCPGGYSSNKCAEKLLDGAAIVATPGAGMGSCGEGYVRFALTVSEDRMKEAVERMRRISW